MHEALFVVVAALFALPAAAQTEDCEPQVVRNPLAPVGIPRMSDDPPLSLAEMLAQLSSSPPAVLKVAAVLGEDAETTRAMMQDPALAERLGKVALPDALELVDVLQALKEVRPEREEEAPAHTLPSRVDLAAASSPFDGTLPIPKTSVGKLSIWTGMPAPLTEDVVKQRRAGAEVFSRLALDDDFVVVYDGEEIRSVDDLISALRANDHKVKAWIQQDIANFALPLWEQEPGVFREVFAPMYVDTGYKTREGKPVIVPAVHSAMHFEITGPDFNTEIEFYQGLRGTGFFAASMKVDQSWVGGRRVETFDEAASVAALAGSALWVRAVNQIAEQRGLVLDGYGSTGVCNDAVALIQQLVTGRTTVYPLVLDKELVISALRDLGPEFASLIPAVQALPYDAGGPPSANQPQRILESIPFAPAAQTPYPGVTDARGSL